MAVVVAAVSAVPSYSMSITASARGVPPESPVFVPWMPLKSIDTRMFSTLVAEREGVSDHVRSKHSFATLPGDHSSKKFSGKSTRAEQARHVVLKVVPLDVSIKGKLAKSLPYHVELKVVPLDVSIKGKLVKLF